MNTYICDIIPNRLFWPSEDVKVDLTDPAMWNQVIESLDLWCKTTHVPLIKEHTPDGGDYGQVISVFENPNNPQAIQALVRIDSKEVLADIIEKSDKQYRFVSPRIRWNHVDVLGDTWMAALLELSLVSVPRVLGGYLQNQIEQVNSEEVFMSVNNMTINSLEIQLSEQLGSPVYHTDFIENKENIFMITDEVKAELAQMVSELVSAELEKFKAEMEVVASEDMPAVEEEVVDEDLLMEEVVEEEDYKMMYEALLSEFEAMKSAMDKKEEDAVMSAVKRDLASRKLDSSKLKSFVKLYNTDKKAYEIAMSSIPVASGLSHKASDNKPQMSVTARALQIQREKGLTYLKSFKLAQSEYGE